MIEKTIKRDPEGRFERHGKAISKTKRKKNSQIAVALNKGKIMPKSLGRPKGSKNKTTLAMKEMILRSLDNVGGVKYLETLAIENSSAYAGLLGKVLPSTLAMPESSGGERAISFERIIVWPDGHREIEGVTPKQLPKPSDESAQLTNQEQVESASFDVVREASDSDGGSNVITFQRIIVWPDGRREIEGKTPKQLEAPKKDDDD